MNVLEIPNCLHSHLTHSTDTHTYPSDTPAGVFSSPGVQNKFKETYSIIQSHDCMEHLSISYSISEQQTWFQKTNKATPHGTIPLPHVTFLLCVCTDMYVELIDAHTLHVNAFKCMYTTVQKFGVT